MLSKLLGGIALAIAAPTSLLGLPNCLEGRAPTTTPVSSEAPRSAKKVMVILPGPCAEGCSCLGLASWNPGGAEEDCVDTQEIGTPTISTDGCCTGTANCTSDMEGCVMAQRTFRFRLGAAVECTCEKADIDTSGADAGQSQHGLTVADGWSNNFTFGGFALPCETSNNDTSGGMSITCTDGGATTPRELANVVVFYHCYACTG